MLLCSSTMVAQDSVVQAIQSDNVDRLSNLLIVEDINSCFEMNGSQFNFLTLALRSSASEVADFLINSVADLNASCGGSSPLIYAIKNGKMEYVKMLVHAGADTEITIEDKSLLAYVKQQKQGEMENYLKSILK